MRKTFTFIWLLIMLIAAGLLSSCVQDESSIPVGDSSDGEPQTDIDDQFRLAEIYSKRAVLYKLARQEGDLIPFTAIPQAVADLDIPQTARILNQDWHTISWESARLAPLPLPEITALEDEVFPLIATRMDDSGENGEWVLLTLSYDSYTIRTLIADAHTSWPPEEYEPFLGSSAPDCLQVWCIKISDEWKILAHMPCPSSVSPPPRPIPPADILSEQSQEETQEEVEEVTEEVDSEEDN